MTDIFKVLKKIHVKVVQMLIETSIEVSEKNSWKNIALLLATYYGYTTMVKRLIESWGKF